MDETELQQRLDEVYDQALVRHGFVDYMRDYELIVRLIVRPGGVSNEVRLLFRNCVAADIATALPEHVWASSQDDQLTDLGTAEGIDGFVWGVNWQALHPGARIVPMSERAARWTQALGVAFHEVRVETNVHTITLVFSYLDTRLC